MSATRISEVFAEIMAYAARVGVSRIDTIEGCWEFEPGPGWFIAVNGHKTPTPCSRSKVPVAPFTAYIEWHGWPAGVVGLRQGFIAAGTEANEATLIAALKAGPAAIGGA